MQIEIVASYKYLGTWLGSRLSLRTHVEHLTKKMKGKTGFLFRDKSCFLFISRKIMVQSTMSVFDYGDGLYMHTSTNTLKPLDAVFHSTLCFITSDEFLINHCVLHEEVGWPSPAFRREQHCLLFIHKVWSGKLSPYLSLLLNFSRLRSHTRSQLQIRQDTPCVNTGREESLQFLHP